MSRVEAGLTRRAIVLGLFCAGVISGFCYFHDCVINPQASIRLVPHLMPHVVYGVLILAVLLLNPLLCRLRRRPLSGGELSVVVALSLIACSVPFYGLVHCWPSALMLPHHYERVTPGWQREQILELAPDRMLADISRDDGTCLSGYVTGLSVGTAHISPTAVPWSAWLRALGFWVPLVLSITLASFGLAVVVHRQWAHHEQLPYPISRFAHALLPGGEDVHAHVFRSRAFWVAAGMVLAIHMNNYLQAWWPHVFIPVRLRLDLSPFARLAPELIHGDGRSLLYPRIMFAVVGIAYFFASDVSFSLAVTPVVMCYISGVLTGYGVSFTRGFSLFHNAKIFLYAGGYFGVFVMCLYTGRYFYWSLLRRSVGLKAAAPAGPGLVWSMRVFLAGAALFTLQLWLVGLDWPFAALYTLIAVMVLVVVSRAIAETGAFYVGTWIMPGALLWGFFGARAIGPQAMVIMILVSVVVLVGPGWAPMPFAVQALKVADLSGVKVSRTALWGGVALLLCVAIALPMTIYWQYDGGVMTTSSGWARYTPKLPFDQGLLMQQQLAAQGLLEAASRVNGWQRFLVMSPNPTFVTAFVIGAVLCLAVSFCRLRFPWWPLHPIVFVFFGTHQAQRLAFSFLLGWLVKAGVHKYGGARAYMALRPVMVGLIAGEVLAGTIPMLVGVIYYVFTHEPPVSYSLLL